MDSDRSARLVGVAFVGAGVAHFARPGFFEAIVPRWVPDPRLANQVSGAAEVALGVAMFPRRSRWAAAWGLLVLLAAVYPANIDMYLHDVDLERDEGGTMIRVEGAEGVRIRNLVRLPLQLLFAWFVWQHTRPGRPGVRGGTA